MQFDQTDRSIKQCVATMGLPRLEAQLLLTQVLNRPREWLIAHDDDELTSAQHQALSQLRQRRLNGEPMAYLLGCREFMGLSLQVSPAVLIPRPDTELLVQTVIDRVSQTAEPRILDLGTGSGAIALAIAHARPDAKVWATDVSAPALDIARHNAKALGLMLTLLQGSWFAAVKGLNLQFDVIVSNPPYIHPTDHHLNQGDLRFEPRGALTEEVDGLSVYRILAGQARQYLMRGGSLCVEHGFDQGHEVASIFDAAGLKQIETLHDLSSHPRVTTGSYNG